MPSSLETLCIPFDTLSGRFSDDWERFRAFWAEPKMPSRLKLEVLWDLIEVGDFSPLVPLAAAASCGEGISMVKLSLLGMGNGRGADVTVAVADRGESPVEDGDIAFVWSNTLVDDVMGEFWAWSSQRSSSICILKRASSQL